MPGPLNDLEAAVRQSVASWLSVLPIILVHGLIGSFAGERTVSLPHPALVLSPDLLGYGTQADAGPESITIEAQVEYLRAVADRAAPGSRVHLAGHSVGGVIAMAFAHRFPGQVARVVNVEGNFTLADAFWSAGPPRRHWPTSPPQPSRPPRAVVEFTGRPGYEPLLREVFARAPVHLVAGARSRAGWHVPGRSPRPPATPRCPAPATW
jgi:lipase